MPKKKKNTPLEVMDETIEEAVTGAKNKQWVDKRFSAIRKNLEIDERGRVGEQFVAKCFRILEYEVTNNDSVGDDKDWDVVVVDDDMYIEVKTATLGKAKTFQRENIDKQRKYDLLVLVDIAPDEIYLSWIPKSAIPWKKLHRRKDGTIYKWDNRLKQVEGKKLVSLEQFKQEYLAAKEEVQNAKKKKKPKNRR